MKKMLIAMAIIWSIGGLIMISRGGSDSTETVNQKDTVAVSNNNAEGTAEAGQKQDQDENVYEANINRLRQFVETVYVSGKEDREALLSGIAKDEVIKEYSYQDEISLDAADYEVTVHHAKYTVNETSGVALFELKTVTEINESTSFYILQVSFDQGMISRVDRFVKIDE